MPAEGDRPSPGAASHADGGNDFDDLHRLGRTLQKLLADEDYLHRLGRYETLLAKNCERTMQELRRLREKSQSVEGEVAATRSAT
jgi:hypothetical protein